MVIIKVNLVHSVPLALVVLLVAGYSDKSFFGSAAKSLNEISPYAQYRIAKFIGETIRASHCSLLMVTEIQGQLQNKVFSNEMDTELLVQNNITATTITTLISNTKNQSFVSTTGTSLKYSSMCNFVVKVIQEMEYNFSDSFLALLTSTENEQAKRDEDHYIFITFSESVSERLLSKIGAQLRFKIAIYPNRFFNQDPFIINTLCIYCPTNLHNIILVPIPEPENKSEQLIQQLFPDFTHNMHEHSIRISAPTKYIPTYEMEKIAGQFRHKRGIHALNFNTVAEKINSSYTLQPCTKFGNVPEGSSGVYLGNNQWAGCMGDVIRGTSDMALSVSPDHRRVKYVHFSSAMEYTPVTFTTAKPKLFYSWTTIFTALNPIIWGFVIASIVVASIAISLIDQYYLTNYVSRKNMLDKLFLTVIYLMGYVVGQDAPCPNSTPSKCIYISWLFYGLLIGATYSCSLQAMIVSPGLDYIPTTFSGLVHSHYKWGASTGFRSGLGEQLFKNSNNQIMRDIYHKMEGDNDTFTCTRKALSQYACFNWAMMEHFIFQTQFLDKSGNHPFQMSTDTAFFTSLNFITRKREIFRSHFNDFLKRSFDSGLAKQTVAMDWRGYRMNVFKTKQQKYKATIKEEGPKSFKFDNVKGGFIVLLCGLLFGLLMFFMEQIFIRCVRPGNVNKK